MLRFHSPSAQQPFAAADALSLALADALQFDLCRAYSHCQTQLFSHRSFLILAFQSLYAEPFACLASAQTSIIAKTIRAKQNRFHGLTAAGRLRRIDLSGSRARCEPYL